MKLNEAKYRSPKWLRDYVDFEVNTGEDIKGEPSKRKAAKLEKERQDKLKAEAVEREAKRKAEAEKEKARQAMYDEWRNFSYEKFMRVVDKWYEDDDEIKYIEIILDNK